MQMAEAAGIPVPKVLSCGEHPDAPFNRKISIVMTRLPGVSLENSDNCLQTDDKEPWLEELKMCVRAMRSWHFPGQKIIASPIGMSLRSPRVPGHVMGPFTNQEEFYEYLISPASAHAFKSTAEYKNTLARAKKASTRLSDCVYSCRFQSSQHPCRRWWTFIWVSRLGIGRLVSRILGIHDSNAVWKRELVVPSSFLDWWRSVLWWTGLWCSFEPIDCRLLYSHLMELL